MPPLNTITIREKAKDSELFNIAVSFNSGPEYPVSIKNPFDPQTEQLFEWYFEEYLKFPFLDTVRAEKAATAISDYGEELFEQVFGDRKLFSEYEKLKDAGLSKLRIELISNTQEFHTIHWESLKDPDLPNPLITELVNIELSKFNRLKMNQDELNIILKDLEGMKCIEKTEGNKWRLRELVRVV